LQYIVFDSITEKTSLFFQKYFAQKYLSYIKHTEIKILSTENAYKSRVSHNSGHQARSCSKC
ncbi:hypothetical protein, partial [Bilophila wadsworthia]|uniref:hypothetical protein n=1 Tax=Bilophila wadsworthia TaxID=35833 RepID=UPI003AB2067F